MNSFLVNGLYYSLRRIPLYFLLSSLIICVCIRADETASVRASLDRWSLNLIPYAKNPYTGQTVQIPDTYLSFEILCAGEVNSTGGFTNFYNVSDLDVKLEIFNYTLPSGVGVTKYTHSGRLPSGITVWASMEEFHTKTWKNYFGWNMSLPEVGQGVKLSVGMYGVNESATAFLDENQSSTTDNMLFIGNKLTLHYIPKYPFDLNQIVDPANFDKSPVRRIDPVRLSPQIDPDARKPAPLATPWRFESRDITITMSFLDGAEVIYEGRNSTYNFVNIDVADPLLTNGLAVELEQAILSVIYPAYYGKDPAEPKDLVVPYLFRMPLRNKTRLMAWDYDPDFSVLFTGTWDAPPAVTSTPFELSQLVADNQTALITGVVVGVIIAIAILGLVLALILSNSLRAKLMPLYAKHPKQEPVRKESAPAAPVPHTWAAVRKPSSPELRNSVN